MRSDDLYALPKDLPIPVDDGACDHLVGAPVPAIALPASDGSSIVLAERAAKWTVVYAYPHTGVPDREPPGGLAAWNAIPGARGCTPQSCSYRDHHRQFRGLGAEVFGLSTQSTAYQQEAVQRLHLPYRLLSDARLEFASALRLPTFDFAGSVFLRRVTLILQAGRVVWRFYPVFPPDADAERVTEWLQVHA